MRSPSPILPLFALAFGLASVPTPAQAGGCMTCTTNAECPGGVCVLHDSDVGCGASLNLCCPGQACALDVNSEPTCLGVSCQYTEGPLDGGASADSGAPPPIDAGFLDGGVMPRPDGGIGGDGGVPVPDAGRPGGGPSGQGSSRAPPSCDCSATHTGRAGSALSLGWLGLLIVLRRRSV